MCGRGTRAPSTEKYLWVGSGPVGKLTVSTTSNLKYMAPGHFCPDVCDLTDFGEADFLRGRVVRAFFRLMELWPKPRR